MPEGPPLVTFPPRRRARPGKLTISVNSQATRINTPAGVSTQETLAALIGAHRACFARMAEIFAPGGAGSAEREAEVRLLMSALQVVQLCSDFLVRRSHHAEVTCRLCAEICRAAAEQIETAAGETTREALARCAAFCDLRAISGEREPAERESA